MKFKLFALGILLFLFLTPAIFTLQAQTMNPDTSWRSSEYKNSAGFPIRKYTTVRLSTPKPLIDGKLDDACWETGSWSGDFTQWIPTEGAKPSQPTEIKILYDDKNIYVAIRAYDNEPDKIQRWATRRDELIGDMVGICFDSYHDYRTGFEFDLSVYGQKVDMILTNPMTPDFNWNAVWYGKTAIEDSAWTAEMEIPLSQVRYSNEKEQVWGMHAWRWINRNKEESDWEIQTSTGPGILYLFGELHGIQNLPKSRRLEFMPYGLGKIKSFEKDIQNPYRQKGYSFQPTAGLDAKIGLSSNFTVDLTINPDFGQVESDPSVMNLTAFETFYEEKRPFFLEGNNIFKFNLGENSLFYSRRLGHSPSYNPTPDSGEYAQTPDHTAILSAMKISGKTADGLSIGILQSFTAQEKSLLTTIDGEEKEISSEPFSNYLVGRMQQDYNAGNTILGGIFTSTNRSTLPDHLSFMNKNAYTGGLDFLHYWNDKKYFIDAKMVGSQIEGDPRAMVNIQRSPAHYFQRPGIDHISMDSTRTRLTGSGGEIRIGRASKGLWRYSTSVGWLSPGLELNDLGYMSYADQINNSNSLSYFVVKPVSIFRNYAIAFEQSNHWNFGGDYYGSDFEVEMMAEFLNKWSFQAHPGYETPSLDPHLLRGGDAFLKNPRYRVFLIGSTDMSKKIMGEMTAFFNRSSENSLRSMELNPGITVRPLNVLKIATSMLYSKNYNQLQYVTSRQQGANTQYLLGSIDQKTIGLTFRIDYSINPELTLQYYGSPFTSSGTFTDFKEVVNPQAKEYADRFLFLPVDYKENKQVYLDRTGDGNADFSIGNPDFNFLQFRSNLVGRWEFKPGSNLFLVWSTDITGFGNPSLAGFNDSMTELFGFRPNHIFLIKFNYWFSV